MLHRQESAVRKVLRGLGLEKGGVEAEWHFGVEKGRSDQVLGTGSGEEASDI